MNNLYKEMVRKPGDLCFEVSLESDKGLTMTDLSFALKFFVYGHPKNVCIHKDDLEVVEGKYYAVLNEHGFVNGVLFCEAEIVETINGINRIVSVRSNTGYMIGNCCQPSVDVSSCAHGYSLSLYKVEYVPQPIDPNPEEDQLVAEELFGEKLSLPELTADRAIADEHGNRIADTYETRQAVRNHIRAVYNEQFIENPPLILDEYITPGMLSEGVKDMLSQAGATINNVPDGEDLTTKQGVLKLSDKPYNPGAYSGLGRVYLRKNLVGGQNLLTQTMVSKPNTIYIIQYDYTLDGKSITIPEGCVLSYEGGSIRDGHINYTDTLIEGKESLNNVIETGAAIHHDNEERKLSGQGMDCIILKKTPYLTQNMVSKPNTIYIIRYNYDLNGAEITIPENCVLDFQGGSFSNGTIVGNITAIQAGLTKIFGLDVELIGTWNVTEACPEWFGAVGDGVNDDSSAIQVCLNSFSVVHFCEKTYCVNTTLNTGIAYLIKGSSDRYGKSIIKNKAVVLFNLNTATGKPYQNYVTFRNIALVNDNISSGYEYGIDTICIKNSVGNPVSVTLENVLIEKFEKGLHNDMPVYYNQIINTRFDTVRFCLSDIHINNLNIDKVRAQTFEDFITIYGGDGPCNIINSTFEKFCGCIAKSGYSTDYTPQINFSNNYIEIYGEVSIPNGFTDRNDGHFGGNTLFEGCFSIINLNGNNFQINDALYLVDSPRVYQLISTGNFFFLVKSDSKLNKLFKISSIDVLTTKDLYIEIINPKTSYSGHSIDGSTFVLNNYYGFDGFDVITGSQYSHYIGLPTLLVGYEAGISGTHSIRHWSDGKNICFKGTVSRTDSSKTDIIDLSSYHIVSDIDIYFNTFDKNNNLVVLKYNHTSKHIEFVSNAGTLEEFYFDGIKIPLITYV